MNSIDEYLKMQRDDLKQMIDDDTSRKYVSRLVNRYKSLMGAYKSDVVERVADFWQGLKLLCGSLSLLVIVTCSFILLIFLLPVLETFSRKFFYWINKIT